MNKIMSFGKYKGQPIEVVQNDVAYCNWLMTQDWVRDKKSDIYQLIINNFGEPSETPEHNSMQVKFLNDNFCNDFIYKYCWTIEHEKKILNHMLSELNSFSFEEDGYYYFGDMCYKYDNPLILMRDIELQLNSLNNDKHIITKKCIFEMDGWDVYLELLIEYPFLKREKRILIEMKPNLGDDYPAILRQMKANSRKLNDSYGYMLIYNNFTASGATMDQVKKTFELSDIKVVSLFDIENKENVDIKNNAVLELVLPQNCAECPLCVGVEGRYDDIDFNKFMCSGTKSKLILDSDEMFVKRDSNCLLKLI